MSNAPSGNLPPGGRRRVIVVAGLVIAAAAAVVLVSRHDADGPRLTSDLFVIDMDAGTADPEPVIRSVLKTLDENGEYPTVTVDYPIEGSVFPPEICPPTFLWHDADNGTGTWLIDVSFETHPHHVYVLTDGKRTEGEIDYGCVTERNVFRETPYQASAKGWTPAERTWEIMKRCSSGKSARVTVRGLVPTGKAVTDRRIVSQGSVTLTTSTDPVGALIFYRDVPLMPSGQKDGVIKPLEKSMWPLIKWRLRDLSRPEATVVMEHLPTCGNCHTFSRDGKTLAMDMDSPAGDKGAYVVKTVGRNMVIEQEDVFTWNDFPDKPAGTSTSGLFAQISPDGRHVVTMLNEEIFVANYTDYRFLQTFYPTRGIIVFWDRRTGEMKRLPGADEPRYVQGNPTWSPDGRTIVFIRATARPAYDRGARPQYANDPNETPIRYDLYSIPFNGGRGGTATPIPGGSANGMSNSFPRFSPDGRWLVWVQCRNGLLMRPDSQLYIMPASGGTPRLMTCNTGRMNSYHSWSPNGRWLVFSSKCNTPYTQMFLTHVDEAGNDSPAVLIPNATAANRAVNLPEFVNLAAGDLVSITTPAVDYRRHLEKARELKEKGRLAEAETEVRKSLALKSDYLDTYLALGNLLVQRGKLDEAIEHYRKALEINSRYFHSYNNLGAALNRQGKYEEALRHFRTALEINPGYPQTHVNIGVALGQLGRPDEAIASFRRASEINPESDRAHYEWGIVLARTGRLDEAVEHFTKAVALDPKCYEAHRAWGTALLNLGKPVEAVRHYRRAIDINPKYVPAYASLAWVLATHTDAGVRNGAEAVRLAETACRETDDRFADLLDVLAAAYAEAGRFDDAVRTAAKALDLARASNNPRLANLIETHLARFRNKQPVRSGD